MEYELVDVKHGVCVYFLSPAFTHNLQSLKSALIYPLTWKSRVNVALTNSIPHWQGEIKSAKGAECTAETERWRKSQKISAE